MKNFSYISEIYNLLGKNTVLLPVKKGDKKAAVSSWKNLSVEDTMTDSFQVRLEQSSNIAVIQGARSNNLCSIDLDHEELIDEFIELNPAFERTLITKGNRGANLWFRADGECPKLQTADWGEVRGEGGYTLIKGIHPSGIEYSILCDNEPIEINFEQVKLPLPRVKKSPVYLYETKSESKSESISISYDYNYDYDYITYDNLTPLKRLEALEESETRYEKWKATASQNLKKNYETYIERDTDMDFSIRNHELIRHTTVLYNMVGSEMAESLVLAFYNIYKPFFAADVHQHMYEFSSHLRTLAFNYLKSLTKEECECYEMLDPLLQDAFRICRDLASFEDDEYTPPAFHLSYQQLGIRLDIHPPQAQRIMRKLKAIGMVSMKKKGQKYKAGRRSKASIWKWNYSLAPIPQ